MTQTELGIWLSVLCEQSNQSIQTYELCVSVVTVRPVYQKGWKPCVSVELQ